MINHKPLRLPKRFSLIKTTAGNMLKGSAIGTTFLARLDENDEAHIFVRCSDQDHLHPTHIVDLSVGNIYTGDTTLWYEQEVTVKAVVKPIKC